MFNYFARLVEKLLAFGILNFLVIACSASTSVPPTRIPIAATVILVTSTPTQISSSVTPTRILRTATATRVPPTITSTRILRTATPTRIPLTPTRQPTKIELKDAAAKGIVKFTVKGDGLESIDVTLESIDDESLEVGIQPGTIFQAMSAGTQSMVVRQPKTVLLKTRGMKVTVEVKVACANMELDAPESSDAFTIRKESTNPDLVKLLSLPDFARMDFRVQQFAIWTITDNPARNGYVGLGHLGTGSGPTAEEFAFIRFTFESAGISTAKYQALR